MAGNTQYRKKQSNVQLDVALCSVIRFSLAWSAGLLFTNLFIYLFIFTCSMPTNSIPAWAVVQRAFNHTTTVQTCVMCR